MSNNLPSLVIVTYPTSSTVILSRPCGPSELLTILATDTAALTFDALTSYPLYLCPSILTPDDIFVLFILLMFFDLNIFKFGFLYKVIN